MLPWECSGLQPLDGHYKKAPSSANTPSVSTFCLLIVTHVTKYLHSYLDTANLEVMKT